MDSMHGVVWVRGLLMSALMDRVAHGGGGVMVWATRMNFIDAILNAQRYLQPDPQAHCCVIFPHPSPHISAWLWTAPYGKALYTIPGSLKHPNCCMVSRHSVRVTHWACWGRSSLAYITACFSSWQYPATSHNHWAEMDQHSTGHIQRPYQLYAKEMCCTGG